MVNSAAKVCEFVDDAECCGCDEEVSIALTDEEINCLEQLRAVMVETAREAITEFINTLPNIYEGLNIDDFVSEVDNLIDVYTQECMDIDWDSEETEE